jgi:MoxR-like ATPase
MVLAAKGHALLHGRYNVSFEDLQAVLLPTFRHRFQLNYEGEAEGIDPSAVMSSLFSEEMRRAA